MPALARNEPRGHPRPHAPHAGASAADGVKFAVMSEPSKLKPWQSALIMLVLIGMTALNFWSLVGAAPEFNELSAANVVLVKPIEVVDSSGPGGGTPWASVQADALSGRIDNLCFLSECNLPAALATLRSGDSVQLWMRGDRIWQLAIGSATLLAYDQTRDAHRRAAMKRGLALGAMLLAGVVVIAWMGARRAHRGLQS